ncbi:hypothetical protein VPH35_043565 [Triticum aestivum]
MRKRGANTPAAVKPAAAARARRAEEIVNAMPGTEAEKTAVLQGMLAFMRAGFEDCKLYMAMEEDDVVEEYRRAGKIHTYDPDKEHMKRLARVAKLHPPPAHMVDKIKLYTYYLEEDEEDFRIGLHSLLDE